MTERANETAAFDVVASLLAIITDPTAAKRRLSDLRAASEEIAQREEKLATDRASFEAERAKVVGELQREREALAARLQMMLDPRNIEHLRSRVDRINNQGEAT